MRPGDDSEIESVVTRHRTCGGPGSDRLVMSSGQDEVGSSIAVLMVSMLS
jgi:hypothetical protein